MDSTLLPISRERPSRERPLRKVWSVLVDWQNPWGQWRENAFLAATLTRVMRAAVPIPAVAAASVLHFAAVGASVVNDVGPL